MPAERRSRGQRSSRRRLRAKPALEKVPNEVAVRYRAGQARRVRKALIPLGTVTTYAPKRMLVLRRASGIPSSTARAILEELERSDLIEFVTPVLRDLESNTRQLLTDEIVLRMKPGRTKRALSVLTAEHGIAIASRNEFEPSQYIVTVPKPSGTQTIDIARSLDLSEDVEFARPNFVTEVRR